MIILILILLLFSGGPNRAADTESSITVNRGVSAIDTTVSGRFMTIDEANAAIMAKAKESIKLMREKDDSIAYLSEQISQRADTLRARIAEIHEIQTRKNYSYERSDGRPLRDNRP